MKKTANFPDGCDCKKPDIEIVYDMVNKTTSKLCTKCWRYLNE